MLIQASLDAMDLSQSFASLRQPPVVIPRFGSGYFSCPEQP